MGRASGAWENGLVLRVVCKRVAANLGVSWSSQNIKLKGRQFQRFTRYIDIDTPSGRQSMLCISTKGLTLWLANVSIESVRADEFTPGVKYEKIEGREYQDILSLLRADEPFANTQWVSAKSRHIAQFQTRRHDNKQMGRQVHAIRSSLNCRGNPHAVPS